MIATGGIEFGTLLRQHRRAARLSQEELAEQAGVAVRTISDLERGVAGRPQRHTMLLLVEALGLDEGERRVLEVAGRRPSAAAGDGASPAARTATPSPHLALPGYLTPLVLPTDAGGNS
jgi:transcriptional regulator with XRE-family HTH domain